MKQDKDNSILFDSIGKRISKVFLMNFKENVKGVDIYNTLYGNDKKQDSSKGTKISDLRNGRNISLFDLMQISQRFNVSLDWLVYGNIPTDPPVQTVYKALTAISEFANLNISVIPMTQENNNEVFRTPYKMNIEITPKFYEQYNDDWRYVSPEYEPREWDYYMDIENYKLAWLLHDWHSLRKTSMPSNEKQIAYDNLLGRINGLHNNPACLAGINSRQTCNFPTLCNLPDMDRENNIFLPLSDYTPPKYAF